MQPSEFWGTDTWTAMDACEGYALSKGVKEAEPTPAMTAEKMDELNDWIKDYERRMAKKAGSA